MAEVNLSDSRNLLVDIYAVCILFCKHMVVIINSMLCIDQLCIRWWPAGCMCVAGMSDCSIRVY